MRLTSTPAGVPGAVAAVLITPALLLGACSTDGGDAGSPASGSGVSVVTGEVDVFLAVARAAGWSCIPGADPYTGQRGATCTPAAGQEMERAVFAVFDRADVPDGASAVRLAEESAGGTGGAGGDAAGGTGNSGGTAGSAAGVLAGKFLPLDSDTVSGYCVDTFGTCAASGFDTLGLTLG